MTAMPVSWHENCLRNFTASRDEKQGLLDRLTADVKRMNAEIEFRKLQIEKAKSLRKDKYDPDRFLGGFEKWQAARLTNT